MGIVFFNSLSVAIIGNESLAEELRVQTCIEMVTNKDVYIKKHKNYTGIRFVSPDYVDAARDCAVDGRYSSAWIIDAAERLDMNKTYNLPATSKPLNQSTVSLNYSPIIGSPASRSLNHSPSSSSSANQSPTYSPTSQLLNHSSSSRSSTNQSCTYSPIASSSTSQSLDRSFMSSSSTSQPDTFNISPSLSVSQSSSSSSNLSPERVRVPGATRINQEKFVSPECAINANRTNMW
uniref:Cell wall integrity and stress response component 1-like n=1 Tax=Saccoglossus kowalevskii TaxID=10224 RepID=A0ABM0MHS4_SACKO|nr:PREDICTED: cell wall integrity and stress response component 1-like [Saccoglossus kowalevskii]